MPINFPTTSTVGFTYTYNSMLWTWNGYAWDKTEGFGVVGTTGATGPIGFTGATGAQGNTGPTGPVGDYVISFNGYTGAVTGWASYNDGAGSGLDTDLIRGISGQRFVENLQSGLLYGGLLTVNAGNTATFDVTAGRGIIVTPGGSTSGYPNAVISYINWEAQTGLTVANLAAYENSWVKINSSGNIVQSTTKWTDSEYDNSIPLGVLIHPNNTSINFAVAVPHVAYGQPSQLDPFVRAFGPIKISGHEISANGANLQVNKSTGAAYMIGRNYTTNPDSPNVVEDTNATPISTVYRYYRDGTGKFAIVTNSSIDPTKWDDGTGTLNSVSGGLYTIQRLFFLPGVPNVIAAYYGRQTYNSIEAAQANIPFETFSEDDSTANLGVFGGYLIVKGGTTQLNNTSDAKFINSGIFRNLSNIGGGGVAATSIDDLTDVTITSATNGQVLKYNGSAWVNGTAVTSFNGLVGAVQGVSAAVAGTGISVSGATGSVTITNTGVQSFNGLTGAVTGVTTSTSNRFTATQIFAAGLTASGITTPNVYPPPSGTITLGVPSSTTKITVNDSQQTVSIIAGSQLLLQAPTSVTDAFSVSTDQTVTVPFTVYTETTGSQNAVEIVDQSSNVLAGITPKGVAFFNRGLTGSGLTLIGNGLVTGSFEVDGTLVLGSGQGITGAVTSFNGLTGAVSGVTAVNAGTGISVTGTTNPTITNTGVQSLTGTAYQITASGATGAVTLSLPNTIIASGTILTLQSGNEVPATLTMSGAAAGYLPITAVTGHLTVSQGFTASGAVNIGGAATITGNLRVNGSYLGNLVNNVNGATGSLTVSGGDSISVTTSSKTITVANTGVTGASAGNGISVSGTTGNVVVTNTGVLSFNSLTGAVSGVTAINAGTGISITGTTNPTITNTGVIEFNGLTGALTVSGGTGMSVLSGGKGITLVNTGVLSVNGSTGAVTNVARTNVDNNFSTSQTVTNGINLTTYGVNEIYFYDDISGAETFLYPSTATGVQTVTLPGGANTTLAGLATTPQTFTGVNTFNMLTTFDAGITASGATFSGNVHILNTTNNTSVQVTTNARSWFL